MGIIMSNLPPDAANGEEPQAFAGPQSFPTQLPDMKQLSGMNLDRTCVNTPSIAGRSRATSSEAVVKCLGRYEIIKKLGEGGMGVVYHARDTATDQEVALKVLAAGCLSQPDALRRFEKEARLLEEAKSPHVANLLDVGTEGEARYLVMEFVRGGDLRQWIKKNETFDESSSLNIIGDLCRALVTAHAKGMVHRDIKPENILLDDDDATDRPVVKLTDFGLARHVDQSESLKLTQTGALLGTPYYMSPEQFTGLHEVSPATDVYAIGTTFFELLTGRRPFMATDPIQLASAHCFDIPIDVRKLNPAISDGIADLVRRMLAKHPGQRPPDASSVLEEILRFQSGESSQFVIHPVLPAHNLANLFHAEFEWDLASSPAVLWPLVSNTDRFNQAAALPPVTYETTTAPDGRIRKFGQFRLAGMTVQWEEYPFEWIEGQKFSVLREFPAGPFKWFMSSVELVPLPEGGTKLNHQVKIQPRGLLGKFLAKLEVGLKGKRHLDRIYRRIDDTLSGKVSSGRLTDAFQEPPGLKRVQRQRLDQRLGELRAAGVSSGIIDLFRDLLINAAAQDLARIQPYALARRFGLPEQDVVEACLLAVRIGLLTLHWDIICPACRLPTGAKDTLREIEQHANCSACQIKFDIEFSTSLELIFRAHPELRSADAKTYCAGGPGNFPHVVAQVRLEPTERLLLDLSLKTGSYVARGPSLPYAIPIEVDNEAGLRHGLIRCVPGANRTPIAMLRSGHQSLALENFFPGEQVIRIERTLRRSEALTAAKVTALPLFRDLFPDQILAPGLLFEIATASFLTIQLARIDEIFRELGDAGTYSLLQDFQRIVERRIQRRGGTVVDYSTGVVLASFMEPSQALKTARELSAVLSANRPQRQWSLCGALHRGPALVTGDRHEVKYFGATINRTQQLALEASPDQLLLTSEIWSDLGVVLEFVQHLRPVSSGNTPNEESVQQIALNIPQSQLGDSICQNESSFR